MYHEWFLTFYLSHDDRNKIYNESFLVENNARKDVGKSLNLVDSLWYRMGQDYSSIHQLTITGKYLRSIELENYPFLRISSIIFDSYDQQLVIVDSFNSIFIQ
jgi:hypothetical protein